MEDNNFLATLFYSNSKISDYDLPESLEDFKSDIQELFLIDSRLNNELSISYTLCKDKNKMEKKVVVKTEDEYKIMRKGIENEIKDKTIIIEIEKNVNDLRMKSPKTFEEQIQLVVERELKNASERIINSLSSDNKKLYPNLIIQDKTYKCGDCGKLIIGDIYKNAIKAEEKFYCENCSFKINEPMFIVH